MASTKTKSIGNIPDDLDPRLRSALIAMKERLELLFGERATSSGDRYQSVGEISSTLTSINESVAGKSDVGHLHPTDYYTQQATDKRLSELQISEMIDVQMELGHTGKGKFAFVGQESGALELTNKIYMDENEDLSFGGDVYLGDKDAGNYVKIDANGHLTLLGDATVFDDVRVSVNAFRLGAVHDPGFTVFLTNGAGSQGVFLFWFDPGAEEEVFFAVQIPHGYKEGSDITPHVHWVPKTNGGANQVVSWGLEYTWANHGEVFGNTDIIYTNTHSPADGSLVASQHYKSYFSAISGTGKTISSMLICRLFRDATGTGKTDDYADDAGLIEFDFHIEMDSVGSNTALDK